MIMIAVMMMMTTMLDRSLVDTDDLCSSLVPRSTLMEACCGCCLVRDSDSFCGVC